jgi:selenocysteine lyase/cysteine desulfurase
MDPWNQLREEIPVVEKWAYFAHAAIGPLPRRSARAIGAQCDEIALIANTTLGIQALKELQ